MKTKTDAAKVLMEKGWTFEEVEQVLGVSSPVVNVGPSRERWSDYQMTGRYPWWEQAVNNPEGNHPSQKPVSQWAEDNYARQGQAER
jgi:hypothetical protein